MEGLSAPEALNLLDWRRRVFALYAAIRGATDPRAAWDRWGRTRHELISGHPQSPIKDPAARAGFSGPDYFPYDPAARVLANVEEREPQKLVIEGSADGRYDMFQFGVARFDLYGEQQELPLFWIDVYGGGVFLPFRDATSGRETYGAGRYLLDTIKGADLGTDGGRLILDFNFAYNPSCSYDPLWACPLAPPESRLPIEVRAGERTSH